MPASPASPRTGPAGWELQDGAFSMRVSVSSVRDALSPGLLAGARSVGVVAALVAVLAGAGTPGLILTGVLAFGLVTSIVSYLRLVLLARELVIRITTDSLSVEDGALPPRSWRLTEVERVLIAHDGAPARVRIDAAGRRQRWTIGQLYRHNAIEPFIEAVPEEVRSRLLEAGLDGGTRMHRGIRVSDFRRS
ncbi:hypothetical protein [Microbacterium sp.]|uniref:hypothetical protein n=1 Tax=Microbacterium sp. TaxID=51671 RepID=UPI003341CFCC